MSIFDQIVITSYNEILIFTTTISYAFAILKQQSFLRRNWVVLCVRTFDDGKGEGNGEQNLKELLSQQ